MRTVLMYKPQLDTNMVLAIYWASARVFSAHPFGAVLLFVRLLSIPVRKRVFGRCPRALFLRIEKTKRRVWVRDGADIAALYEVFVLREYDLENVHPRHIIDIGAHIGSTSLFFAMRYPNARITAYEPDPDNFPMLLMNTRDIARIECVNAAVTSRSGPVTFYPSALSSIGSSLTRRPASGDAVEVKGVSVDDILTPCPDFVKFDVEGAEFAMFAAASQEALRGVGIYIGELHYDLMGATKDAFRGLFPGFKEDIREIGPQRAIVYLRRAKS